MGDKVIQEIKRIKKMFEDDDNLDGDDIFRLVRAYELLNDMI